MARRAFLHRIAVLAAAATGLALSRCGGTSSTEEIRRRARSYPELDCDDTSDLWPAEIATREHNDYRDRSPHETRFCFNCSNFLPASEPAACGRCKTVKGPIDPLGWCKAWTEARLA